MLTTLTLAVMASLLLPVQAVKQPPTAPPQKLNAVLCQSEAQAIALAEVCGRYVGYAAVEVEKTRNHHGGLFMLAGRRFAEDDAFAWTASWVTPFEGANLERGA